MNAKITFLISTLNDGVNGICLPIYNSYIRYIVVHQNPQNIDVRNLIFFRHDVEYISDSGVGLSRSRNIAIRNVKTKYAYILDDDVIIIENKITNLLKWISNLECHVYLFQIRTPDGGLYKKYSDKVRRVNMVSAARVSSIELFINADVIKEKGLFFDEDFGLGSDFPSGEEYIFISDCLRSSLNVYSIPEAMVIHEKDSSGKDFYSSKSKVLAKKKMFQRVTKKKISLLQVLFFIKKAPEIFKNKKIIPFVKDYFF